MAPITAMHHPPPKYLPITFAPATLRVVTYHRVEWKDEYPDLYPKLNSCTPKEFARQLDFYNKSYDVVSLNDVFDHIHGKQRLPPRALLVTFDDAYQCIKDNVWPVAKKKSVPFTVFVPTAFPDCRENVFWWDRLYFSLKNCVSSKLSFGGNDYRLATNDDRVRLFRKLRSQVKSLPHGQALELVDEICDAAEAGECPNYVLGWKSLRKLATAGVQLAPHTRTHPMLNRISIDEAVQESVGSMHDLARATGTDPVRCLAYPSGGVTSELSKAIRDAGFELAFTTQRGLNTLRHSDLSALRRINVGTKTSILLLRLQLSRLFPSRLVGQN